MWRAIRAVPAGRAARIFRWPEFCLSRCVRSFGLPRLDAYAVAERYVEGVIGSIRRECLDHRIVVHAAGLHRVLTASVALVLS